MVDIFHYKELIETIQEERSFSKAANRLHIPQPSLSVMVKKIEDEIGVPLFDRTSKPIRLTQAGEEYLQCAAEIKIVEKNFGNYIDSVSSLKTGTLRIGAGQMLSELVLPHFLAEFIQKYPGITIQITDENSQTLEDKLASGGLDIIIDSLTLDEQIFEHQVLREEHVLLAVPTNLKVQPKGALTLQDILDEKHLDDNCPVVDLSEFDQVPFVLLTKNNKTRRSADHFFRQISIQPNILLEVDRMSTNFRYIALGLGAGFVSDTFLNHLDYNPENVVYYRIKDERPREISVFYKRSRYYSRIMEAFIEELQKAF